MKHKTCNTCKHWEKPESERGEIPGTGRCKAVVQFWDASAWEYGSEARVLRPEHAGKLAFVQDGSDYFAALKTIGSFGCVQHETQDK